MQPYFFPYLGYWQLISQADIFVVFDDVNYIKKGFIDRNFIVRDNREVSLKLQIQKASQNKKINQLLIGRNKAELAETVRHVYRKAPQFKSAYPFVEELILCEEENLALYLENTIRAICKLLQITAQIYRSSNFQLSSLGKEKIIPLLIETGAETYINPIGGRAIYKESDFLKSGKSLQFFKPDLESDKLITAHSHVHASILHFILHHSPDELSKITGKGCLVAGS